MRIFTLLTVGIAAAMTAGCANDQHVYYQGKCLSCMNNPITGEPVNYDPATLPEGAMTVSGFNTGANQSSNAGGMPVVSSGRRVTERHELNMSYAGDVDTAAALLKNAFNYMTPEEAIAEKGSTVGRLLFQAGDNAYSAVPGATYSMTKPLRSGSLTTRVSKAARGTDILFTYTIRESDEKGAPPSEILASVKSVAERALR